MKLQDFIPTHHPLRPIRLLVNTSLKRLNGPFSSIYAETGRASLSVVAKNAGKTRSDHFDMTMEIGERLR